MYLDTSDELITVLGRWGTVARVLGGSGLIVLATAAWRADWLALVLGLVALPAVATSLMWLHKRSSPPLRLGATGHLVTIAHVAVWRACWAAR